MKNGGGVRFGVIVADPSARKQGAGARGARGKLPGPRTGASRALMTEFPIQGILLRVLSALEAVPTPDMIMGGFAVRAVGIPRPTYDADLTVEAFDKALARLFKALEGDGFIIPDEFRKGFRDSLLGMAKVKVQKLSAPSRSAVEGFRA